MQEIPKYLPPNLQPPINKQTLPLLTITVDQVTLNPPIMIFPQYIRFKWWGLGSNKQIFQPIQQKNHKFYISVSAPMFLRYCHDMKVLELQLCDRVKICIARGWINWLLLDKLWDGRDIQMQIQLKSHKKQSQAKVGEMKLTLKIEQVTNHLYSSKQQPHIISNTKGLNKPQNKLSQQKIIKNNQNQNINTRPRILQQNIDNYSQSSTPKANFINYNIYPNQMYTNQPLTAKPHKIQTQFINHKKNPNIVDKKTALFMKLDLPLPDECICEQIKPNKFTRQKLQLKQQLDLFFNRQYSTNQYQQIQIQIIRWQPLTKSDSNLGTKLDIPILDTNGNIFLDEYSFKKSEGQIKIKIDSLKNRQQKIKQYITNNQILVTVGDCYIGSIPLFKVLGSKGYIISVGIFDKRNKKQTIKGHIFLKLVLKPKQIKKSIKNINSQENVIESKIAQVIEEKPSYTFIWLFLQQLHFLQPKFWQNSNIFATLKPSSQINKPVEQLRYNTKTVWNSNSPIFNQIIVMQIEKKDTITISFWNRSQAQRVIGKAQLNIDRFEFKKQIPVVDGFNRTIGYLGLCVGNGDIRQATQFLNTHSRSLNSKSNKIPKQQQIKKSQYSEQIIPQQHKIQPQIRSEHNSLTGSSQSNPHILPNPIQFHPCIKPPKQQSSALESHNQIFTSYLFREYDWLQNYQNKYPTIGQFSQLLKPICQLKNYSKFLSIYLNTNSNTVSLQYVKQSIQAFSVYYQILLKQRDNVLEQVINQLANQGINLIQLENIVKQNQRNNGKKQIMWKKFKQYIEPKLLQHLRYFYQHKSIQQICDSLRKFQVYETSKGQQIPIEVLTKQVLKQICELLDLDPHARNLRSQIKQAGLQLSKFQLLCLFDQIPKATQNKMVKSPTFGYLNTDRLPAPKQIKIQQNPSIDFNTQHRPSLSGLSQKFGNPNISPINKNTLSNNKKIRINFMDLPGILQKIYINNYLYDIDQMQIKQNGEIQIVGQKKFNYLGYVQIQDKSKIQFQGPAKEWIGLVDQDGEYCGCVIIQ